MEEDEEKSDDSSDHHGSVEDCKSSTEVAYEPDIVGNPISQYQFWTVCSGSFFWY